MHTKQMHQPVIPCRALERCIPAMLCTIAGQAWCTAEVQAASLGVTPSHKLLTMRSLRRGEHAFSRALHPVEKARRCSSIIAAVHNMLLTHSSPQCPLFFGKAEATAASGHFPITLNHSTAFSSV